MHFSCHRSGVMLSCWSKDPLERPSFSDIVCQLPKLCEFQNTAQEVGIKSVYEMKISISGFLHFLKIWAFPIIKTPTLLKNSDQKFVNFTIKVRF